MVRGLLEIIPVAMLLTDLLLVASGRLFHCIKLTALQGILLGIFPLLVHDASGSAWQLNLVAVINLSVKGILLPMLLSRAMRQANVRRELEPFIGYSASLFWILAAGGFCFWICREWNLAARAASPAAVPVAFTTMITGLFIIITRRKAITQVIGFLVFENAIAFFGIAMRLEHGWLVELGILLDVLVLVFVMGIAVFRISREFAHIDSDKLNQLGDWVLPEENEENEESEQ